MAASKVSYGVPTKHILKSQGGESDIMKFYCTSNNTTYGQKWSKFQPRQGKHTGTGYLSNFRPGVYYSERLDQLDNPVMGEMIKANYESITSKHFKPYKTPDGTEPLPNSSVQMGSGFVRQKPCTIPTQNEVKQVAIDTRVASAPIDIRARHKPHLHKLRSKDPVQLENGGYGPGYMTTETSQKFQSYQPDRSSLARKSVGPSEETGFTHAKNVEPITFHPDYAHRGDHPPFLTDRPIGVSIKKTSFLPYEFSRGNEPLPRLANRSVRETGFTSGTNAHPVYLNRNMSDAYDKASDMPPERVEQLKKKDPAEYLNATRPNNYSSITTAVYQGKQRADPSAADRLGRTDVGLKEETGFTENNDRFVQTFDNPARFITHYDTRFIDRTPYGVDREGHTWGGVQPLKPDGFTRSTRMHANEAPLDTTATLRRLEPYVGRSVRARDVFFDDHTHDSKLRSTASGVPDGNRSATAVF